MFAVKPYYLSSSGTLDYNFGYIYSTIDNVLKPSTFNLEVPLASSIEATMEWCNRVAAKHDWASENNPICDVSGFYWEHYDGNRQLKRIIPSASPPYQITGDSILGSGFYTRYRDIVKFMGENTLQNWQSPSGATWTNMEISRANNWENLDDLNTRAKITKGHYHQYIYRGGPQFPHIFGGFFTKKYSNSVTNNLSPYPYKDNQKEGWDDPLNSIMVTTSSVLSAYWFNDGYVFGPKLEWRDWDSTYTDTTTVYGSALGVNIDYPLYSGTNGLKPLPQIGAGVQAIRSIGFSRYQYNLRAAGVSSGVVNYNSMYSIMLENSFAAAYYPVDTRQTVINRTLKHLLGIDKWGISLEVSGYHTPGTFFSGSGNFLSSTLYNQEIDIDSNWYGNYRLVYGSIYYQSGRLCGQGPVNYQQILDATETSILGDKTAEKIRNSQYDTLASITISEPIGESGLYTYFGHVPFREHFTPYVSGYTSINASSTLLNVHTPDDNLIFFALFSEPFEGQGIIDASFRVNSPNTSWNSAYPTNYNEKVTSTIDSNILSTTYRQIYPSSEVVPLGYSNFTQNPLRLNAGWASWEHHSEWW